MDYRNLSDEQLKELARNDRDITIPEYLEKRILDKIQKNFKPFRGNIIQLKRKRIIKRAVFLAAAVIIIVLSPILIINYSNQSHYSVLLVEGNVSVERNGEISGLNPGDNIYENDMIITSGNSYCSVGFKEDTVIWINSSSRAVFDKAQSESTVVKLLNGVLISSVAELMDNESYSVITDELSVTVNGTVFLVEAGNGTSRVAVNKGVVDIDYFDENSEKQKIELKRSESFSISSKKTEKTQGFTVDIINSFNEFEAVNSLILKEELEENIPVQAGFISELRKSPAEEKVYEWRIKKIYNGTGENVINISVLGSYAVSQNISSFSCFSLSGKLLWERSFSEDQTGLFDTPAVIYGNRLYAAGTRKKLVILNLDNGKEIEIIEMPGTLSKYSHITVYKNTFFLPFADGIYTLDFHDNSISESAVIKFPSPVALIKSGEHFYVSSFVSKEIAGFDNNYNELWRTGIGDRLFSIPVITDNIIVTSWSGKIFKLDLSGNIKGEAEISEGFISAPGVYGSSVYILANSGKLIEADLDNLEVTNTFIIDKNPDPENYIYKSPAINKNILVIGSDTGKINIYNLDTDKMEKTFETGNASICSKAGFYEDTYFLGNSSGDIYIVEYAEAE